MSDPEYPQPWKVVELGGLKFHLLATPESIRLLHLYPNVKATASLDHVKGIYQDLFYFSRLFLSPNIRGRGIGSKMVKEILTQAKALKRGIWCDPNPYDGPSREEDLDRFYMRAGFKEMKDEYGSTYWRWDPEDPIPNER